jgi:hypothetical protein
MNPHTPKCGPTLGVGVPMDSQIFKKRLQGSTHWIKNLFISLENYKNVDAWNGLEWPIWTSETQVMAKKKAGSQICNLISNH